MGEEIEDKVEDQSADPKGDGKDESVVMDELAGIDLDVDLHKEGEESEEEKAELPEPPKEDKPPEPTPKEKEMEGRLSRLETDKRDLQKALHEARQERKKLKDVEPVTLTDAELMKIVEEHKDDPKVMFNALDYKMKELMKKGTAQAVNEVEIKARKQQLDGILRERVKTFDDEGSEAKGFITRAKTDFNLEDHPYGDFLGAAAAVYMNLQAILDERFEQGKKVSLNDKAEEARKKDIKGKQPIGGGPKLPVGKGSLELTPSQSETARILGFKTPEELKLYKIQLLKNTPTNA